MWLIHCATITEKSDFTIVRKKVLNFTKDLWGNCKDHLNWQPKHVNIEEIEREINQNILQISPNKFHRHRLNTFQTFTSLSKDNHVCHWGRHASSYSTIAWTPSIHNGGILWQTWNTRIWLQITEQGKNTVCLLRCLGRRSIAPTAIYIYLIFLSSFPVLSL